MDTETLLKKILAELQEANQLHREMVRIKTIQLEKEGKLIGDEKE